MGGDDQERVTGAALPCPLSFRCQNLIFGDKQERIYNRYAYVHTGPFLGFSPSVASRGHDGFALLDL